jgi:hypothetical protein
VVDNNCPGTYTCTYRVRAYTDAGFGNYSPLVTVQPMSPASAPQNFTAARIDAGNPNVQLSWQPPANVYGSTVSGYYYDVSYDGGSSWSVTNRYVAAPTTSVVDNNCPGTYTCTYRVRAYTDAGFGNYSPLVTVGPL